MKLQEAEEDVESTAPQANGSIAQIDECGVPILSRTPSIRPISRGSISRSGHSSFRSSFRASSLEPVEPGVSMAPHANPMGQQSQTTRLHSFKRNRPSFIQVTAEALSRQKSPVEPGVSEAPHAGPMGQQLQTTRLHNFKRNRPSFIHVTAEALSRQKSQRLHSRDSAPWEYQNTITGWEYLCVNLVLKNNFFYQPT